MFNSVLASEHAETELPVLARLSIADGLQATCVCWKYYNLVAPCLAQHVALEGGTVVEQQPQLQQQHLSQQSFEAALRFWKSRE